ncbi:MAG TPA: phosphoribosylamine--glycine ligase [Candidatus Acidoferrales bacterium]|jgi:phosphoribosylamine--glycine ligase|nr:phosphoribosylamine--glycine ligase [Candidatus Acidoferrales bacterium]
MKILVIGGGGREHAIVWKLARSASVEKIWCAPGNAGIAADAECLPLDVKDPKAAADLAARLGADLTIVGPEVPLVAGIADEFAKRSLALLGPAKAAAQLEGSKIFAKQFMERHGIPTAGVYGICDSAAEAYAALTKVRWPLVIKADGLCAGKGVLVTTSEDEARAFTERVMERHEFGDAGTRLLLEETLAGDELSYIILTDGADFIRMAPARDHKRAYDNDEGPNTGGMGVYSTDEILPAELEKRIIDTIVRPTLDGLKRDRTPYRGFLYFGLMLTPDGPQVLEYNCRLGDPETEAVLLRADFDFGQACMQAATGSLRGFDAKWARGGSVCVVIASKGYPGDPQTGVAIDGLEDAANVPGAVVFHAGTKRQGAACVTNGGRVLVVSAAAENLASARATAYEAVRRIRIEGSFYRTDIGPKNFERKDASSAKTAR